MASWPSLPPSLANSALGMELVAVAGILGDGLASRRHALRGHASSGGLVRALPCDSAKAESDEPLACPGPRRAGASVQLAAGACCANARRCAGRAGSWLQQLRRTAL